MALTYEKAHSDFDTAIGGEHSGIKRWIGTVTFDDAYPAGGEAVTAAGFDSGASELVSVQVTRHTGINDPGFDAANSKLQLFAPDTGLETATADQSTTIVNVVAYLKR